VRLAHCFAIENDLIRADAIEASEFPDLVARYSVYAVPRTVINGEAFVEGSLPEEFFLDAVLKAVNPETRDGEAL
jgi:alkyl hydroperoxide reductase subunit AhpF